MTDVIEKWLLNSIGVNIRVIPDVIGDACFDGTLFAKILIKYNICSTEYAKSIHHTNHFHIAYSNLKKLCVWFKLLGISFSDEALADIAKKDGSAALRLLYELFTRLENRENMRYIDAKEMERLLTQSTDKFAVERVAEPKEEVDVMDENRYVKDNLAKGKNTIDRFLDKRKNFLEKCIEESAKRRALLAEEVKSKEYGLSKIADKALCAERQEEFYRQISDLEEYLNMPERTENARHIFDYTPKTFVSLLKLKSRKTEEEKLLKEKMAKDALRDTWRDILIKKEEETRDVLAMKLFKQSEYEKEMMLRLRGSRFRYKKFIDNRKLMLNIEEKQKFVSELKESFRATKEAELDAVEKQRIKELHKKLFTEKKKLKYRNDYTACRKIFGDITDFAIIQQEYKTEFNNEPPKQKRIEWRLMFLKGLPFLDWSSKELERDLDGTIIIDDECSEILAEYERSLYNALIGPWSVRQFADDEKFHNVPERLNVIGHMVHRLLNLKYEFEMTFGTPADVDHYNTQVLLMPLKNIHVIGTIKKMLSSSKIILFEVTDAVNYVLNSYKTFLMANQLLNDFIAPMSDDSEGESAGSKWKRFREELKFRFLEKCTGTISRIDSGSCQDTAGQASSLGSGEDKGPTLPRPAALGKLVFAHLYSGSALPTVLTCQVIIEYIKSLQNINGWVLLNYPQNLKEVATLEYMFSGREVPFLRIAGDSLLLLKKKWKLLEEELIKDPFTSVQSFAEGEASELPDLNSNLNLSENKSKETDNISSVGKQVEGESSFGHPTVCDIINLKRSELVPNPKDELPPPNFESMFTQVIQLEVSRNDGNFSDLEFPAETAGVKKTRTYFDKWSKGDKTFLELTSGRSVDFGMVGNFYENLDISVTLHCEGFPPSVLGELGRIILQEPPHVGDVGWKPAEDLFGFGVLSQEKPKRKRADIAANEKTKQKEKFKDMLNETVYQKVTTEGLTKFLYDRDPEVDDIITNTVESTSENELLRKASEESVSTEVLPGQPNWSYSEPYVLDEFQNPLATIWETIEFFYKYNLVEIFNFLRSIDCKVLPYRAFILNKSKQCVELSDDRNSVASNFQAMLNSISENLRPVKSMKNELHCRAYGLQCSLWKIADVKKLFSDQIMHRIRSDSWLAKCICNYLRSYTCLIQIEVDRFFDTMQLIMDYHCVCLFKQTSHERLVKIVLPTFEWNQDDSKEELFRSTSGKMKKTSRSRKERASKLEYSPKRCFTSNPEEPLVISVPDLMVENPWIAVQLLNNISEAVKGHITDLNENCNATCEEMTRKPKSPKISGGKKISARRYSDIVKRSKDFDVDKFVLQWLSALRDETDRTLFRISLITARANKTLANQITVITDAFRQFKNDIVHQYHVELFNIDKFCDLMRAAIEEEVKVQPSIILEKDKFFVDPDYYMYPSPPPPPPTPLEEIAVGHFFTITQLNNFVSKMNYVAPFGIVKESLILILQDMACFGHELSHPYIPPAWTTLSSNQISALVDNCFGDKAVINWKEFVVFGLDFRYPSLEEILQMKRDFVAFDVELSELVTYEQFIDIHFWFENNEALGLHQSLRIAKAKELLFKLFQVNDEHMNYSCFLLAFCRDENPVCGLVKALAAIEGFLTVSWKGELFREEGDEEIEKVEFVKEIINEIFFNVVHIEDIKILDGVDKLEKDLFDLSFNSSKLLDKENDEGQENEPGGSGNTESDEEETEHLMVESPDWGNELVRLKLYSPFWKSDVHYDTIISLLIYALHYCAMSPEHISEQVALEKKLNHLFFKHGDGYTAKLFVLVEDDGFKDILSSYRLFQSMNLSKYTTTLVSSESTVLNEYLMN